MRLTRTAGWLLLAMALAPTALAAPSEADKAIARELVWTGDEELARGHYEAALAAYRGADEVMHVPTTGIQVARALVLLGRLRDAQLHLQKLLALPAAADEPEPFQRARAEARALMLELDERVPMVDLVIEPSLQDVVLTANGRVVHPGDGALRLDPGRYALAASAPGHRRATAELVLGERARERVVLHLEPAVPSSAPALDDAPPAEEPPRAAVSPLVWAGLGTAAAGSISGVVTGLLSLARIRDADARCRAEVDCGPAVRPTLDEAEALALASTTGFVLAGAGALVGITALVADLGGGARVEATAAPTGLSLRVGF